MGKRGKKQRDNHRPRRLLPRDDEDGADSLPSSAYDLHSHQQQEEADAGFKEDAGDEDEGEGEGDREEEEQWRVEGSPSKFHLYQISVQVLKSFSFLYFLPSQKPKD